MAERVEQMRFNGLLHLTAFSGKAHGDPPASGFVKNKMPDSPAPSQVAARPRSSPCLPLSGYLLPLVLAVFVFLALACSTGDAGPTAVPEPQPVARNLQERMEVIPAGTVEATETVAPGPTPTVVVADAAPPPQAQSESTTCRLIQGDPGRPGEVELHVEVIADGLEIPWGLVILPSGDLLVTERPGRVRLIEAGEVVPEPVLEFGVSILPPLFGNPIAGSEAGCWACCCTPNSRPIASSTSSTT